MSVIRVCFMGTPDFAATHLKSLLKDDHYQVVAVVTQPDRPSGRNLKLSPSPVKALALEKNIPVYTPEKLSQDEAVFLKLTEAKAEICIVVAFGQLLKQNIIDLFKAGVFNVHGSLLPHWRGAAPIQRALEAGDKISGVCLQKMVLKLDAGPVIATRKMILDEEINSIELYKKFAQLGCELLTVDLMDYIRGNLAAIAQDETQVSIAKKISKDESLILWSESAKKNHNKIRGFAIGPGCFAFFQGKRIKIHATKYIELQQKLPFANGEVTEIKTHSFCISSGGDEFEIFELQPESKPRMTSEVFIKSFGLKKGDRFE